MNKAAPITIRVNPTLISAEQLKKQFYQKYELYFEYTKQSRLGLNLLRNDDYLSLYELEEFKKGLFEFQDEASQLAAMQVNCQPGQQVLDYCAGAGGKALLFSSFMKDTGQLYLHDVNQFALKKAQKRFSRNPVNNVQYHSNDSNLKKRAFDWLVCDVPCSGTGTLRRNPDIKYKLQSHDLVELVNLQREIVKKALKFMKKDGYLVYMTCSLLKQENQEQVEYFCKTFKMKLVNNNCFFQTLPQDKGPDSLFTATLQYA